MFLIISETSWAPKLVLLKKKKNWNWWETVSLEQKSLVILIEMPQNQIRYKRQTKREKRAHSREWGFTPKRRHLNKFKTGQTSSVIIIQFSWAGDRRQPSVNFPPHCSLFQLLSLLSEFGMKDDLRKIEVGGVSSHDLYVKREYRSMVTSP